ncbi:MAG: oligopeptide transporter, OPT family [candidate division Zixibacteria bacterium]|nr:oligopeptide transporter, OPT family [Candidatus Tariuqbacter arcticus]
MGNKANKMELPENAYRELKPGETYTPVLHQEKGILEVTMRSILFGVVMAILFAGAASYIALKLGQGIEAAIPISILAIGFSALVARKSTMIENVNILAIGATSGIVAGGSVFVMPALFILDLNHNFFHIFLVPLLGAILGVLFLIPFRRYFVADQHGKLPFPEGTAIVEVLVTGERGGKQAGVLAYAIGIGAVFDFFMTSMRAWAENFSTSMITVCDFFTYKVKLIFNLYTSAATLGLGYLIGVRYASIIFAGSLMSYFVLVPIFAYLGGLVTDPVSPGKIPIGMMTADEIFTNYARYVGIGGIFTAGLISIIKMSSVIFKAVGIAFREIFKMAGKGTAEEAPKRYDQSIPMSWVMIMLVLVTIAIWVYFRFVVLAGIPGALGLSLISIAITLVISFLFIAVSAWAVAMISVTPISGMTLMTLMITAVIFSQIGLSGKEGMLITLLVGGVVCTALSMAGSLVTQYKLGYWLGSTPKSIEWANIMGCVLASVVVTLVIILLAQVYGFTQKTRTMEDIAGAQPVVVVEDEPLEISSLEMAMETEPGEPPETVVELEFAPPEIASTISDTIYEEAAPAVSERKPLPAPQANAMAAVLGSIMGDGQAPWFLYGMGVIVALLVNILGINPLAFALGMYLPIELNSPILAGAIVGWLVKHSTKNEALAKIRHDKGILVASGLIAGGALIGVLDALIKFIQDKYVITIIPDLNNVGEFGNWLGLILFVLLGAFLFWDAWRAKPEKEN